MARVVRGGRRWIEIVNWDRFQHYADRDPIWIKNYTALLDNPDYRNLTLPQRATLHGLWLLYAKSHRAIRDDTASVTRALGVRVTSATLEALNDAGFIRFRASKPLAQRREEKRKKQVTREKNTDNGPARDPDALRKIKQLADRIGKT